jgi:hypothetical protein
VGERELLVEAEARLRPYFRAQSECLGGSVWGVVVRWEGSEAIITPGDVAGYTISACARPLDDDEHDHAHHDPACHGVAVENLASVVAELLDEAEHIARS